MNQVPMGSEQENEMLTDITRIETCTCIALLFLVRRGVAGSLTSAPGLSGHRGGEGYEHQTAA